MLDPHQSAWSVHMAVQDAETHGPIGRKTSALIERAKRLSRDGFRSQAMPLFMEAAELHAEDATDAIAASAFHALAVALDDLAGTGRRTALHEADRWFRRARASEERNRSALRRGTTLYSHAACLRHLAHDAGPVNKEELVDEAERCLRAAASALESLGPLAIADLASCLYNLGNLLGEERNDFQAAASAYMDALRLTEAAFDFMTKVPETQEVLQRTAAKVRRQALPRYVAALARTRPPQAKVEAKRLAERHVADPDLELADEMVCVLADLLLSSSRQVDFKAARQVLRQRRPDQLARTTAGHAIRRASLLKRAGLRDEAMAFLQDAILAAWRRRQDAVTDNDSDQVTEEAQAISYVLAAMQLDKRDAVEAFLTLENNAGLRFNDSHVNAGYRPGTPQARYLYERWLANAELNSWLIQILEAARLGSDDDLVELLDEISRHPPADLTDGMTSAGGQALLDLLRQIPRTSAGAQAFIEQKIRDASVISPRALGALRSRDAAARDLWSVQWPLDPDGLAAVLAKHPGVVVLRLVGQDQHLMAITAWDNAGELHVRSANIPVTTKTRNSLFRATYVQGTSDLSEIDTAARTVDLAPALPAGRIRRLVVLPSAWARLVPVAALAVGKVQLVDVADAIVQLPNLAPLRQPRHTDPLRQGELCVVGPNVAVGDLIFGARPPNGPLLLGEEATWLQVREAARRARTVALVAHGEHTPYEHPELQLAGDDRLLPDGAWRGTERVELWACSSGLSLPHDFFATHADEGFGLDYAFVHVGALSAIGTQWPVSELATALIARYYRSQLATGLDAPTALVAAQRWWRSTAVPAIVSAVAEDAEDGLARAIERLLGVVACPDLSALLAPIDAKVHIAETISRLKSCWSWAGFRFVGWDQGIEVPHVDLPDANERAEIDADLARPEPDAKRFADAIDAEIARRFEGVGPRGVTAADAREVALLFSLRWRDATESNLIRGLAWIHEALADQSVSVRDAQHLRLLAAWLWLDVAEGESPLSVSGAAPTALRRTGELLTNLVAPLPNLAQAVIARRDWLEKSAVGALGGLPALADHMLTFLDFETVEAEDVELAALVSVWLVLHVSVARRISDPRRSQLNGLLDRWTERLNRKNLSGLATAETASVARAALAGIEPTEPIPDVPAWALAAWLQAASSAKGAAAGGRPVDMTRSVGAVLGDVEAAVTGYKSDLPGEWWRGLAVPGEACRYTAGTYLESHRLQQGASPHVLACLQFQSDLMPSWCGALTRFIAHVHAFDEGIAHIFSEIRRLRHIDDTLRSAALIAHPGSDGFQLDALTLMQRLVETGDPTAWVLAGTTAPDEGPARATRTAAFAAVRYRHDLGLAVAARSESITAALTDKPENRKSALDWLRPLVSLEEHDSGFRSLQPGYGCVGVFATPMGTLGFVAAWNAGAGLEQSNASVSSVEILPHLARLLMSGPGEADATAAFSAIDDVLREPLRELLGTALKGPPLHWSVLAPGPLRSLPWLGLHAGSKRIAEGVLSWAHVASISKGAPLAPKGRPRVASLLTREPSEGSTVFTAHVEDALRRWRPVDLCVERAAPNGRNIDEVLLLEPTAPTLDLFRVCSVGSPQAVSAVTAGFQLDRSRTFGVHNLIDTAWAHGARIELWTDHHSLDDMMLALGRGQDRLPGLVGPLLAGGAQSVLDLAWPIHDLVKALVLEQYAWQGGGVVSLRRAVESVRTLLTAWSKHAVHASSLLEALTMLETGRALLVERSGAPPVALARFTVPSGDVQTFVRDVLDPVHLAAFRWWGMH